MGIETIIGMIPKGGKYAQSVVNFVRKAPEHWGKFKEAIKQIDDLLKIGRLRLDGKQKTIFETNKNILKNHEKVTKKVEVPPVKKEDMFKGWTPTVVERQNLRNVYKKLPDKEGKLPTYTKEMEAIDEELNELMIYQEGKYKHLEPSQKEALYEKLQAQMEKLMAESTTKDLSKLSLSQLNKKSQSLQKRIREIKDNPDIKGTVTEGPKADMIDAIYKSENAALTEARNITTRNKNLKKYGDKFPRLDPENDAFIILKLDKSGNTMRVGRWSRRFGATKDKTTGELTRQEGTAYWDKWDSKTGKLREEGKEVWHETVDAKGKTIMSNPEYKIPKTENMELQTELYTNLSTSDLAKKGYKLKDIDMIMKGREVRKYLETQEAAEKGLDTGIKMHERTNTNEITNIMEDLYFKGDDVYKMSIEEWTKKIPEYFAEGGRTGFHRGSLRHQKTHDFRAYEKPSDFFGPSPPENWVSRLLGQERDIYLPERDALESFMKERFMYGEQDSPPNVFKQIWLDIQKLLDKKRNKHATGGISNLFQERQGFRSGELITGGIKLVKGARWLIRMLKDMLDDMIYGGAKFAKMAEAEKIKYFKQTESAIKQLESGGPIPDEIIQSMRQDPRFKGLTVTGKDKDFIEIQEVVLGKLPKGKGEIIEGKAVEEIGAGEKILKGTVVDEKVELFAFMNELPKDLQHKIGLLPVEQQVPLLRKFKKAFDATKTGGAEGGVDVLQKQLLEDFIPKGKGNAEGGLISGYATGGVSNLFRQRQGFRTGNIAKLPEFLKFVEGLLIKASNQIRQGLGKWKGLADKQKWAQHDNLTKIVTEFMRTKKFDPKMNEYFGIDAEKAFIEAQAKVKKTVPEVSGIDDTLKSDFEAMTKSKVKKTRTMDDVVEDAYQEVFYQKPSSGDYKYDADVLATEIAFQGGKIYDDLAAVEKAGIYDLAYKRVIQDLQINRAKKIAEKNITDLEQKIELQMFDPKGKKGNAEGGLIPGYATGGVSNLFRSR